ncbi:hypothetical protein [Amycolatopsis marina]|uniref:hypothetical protein n=1 Tax=Amycolatopsis marina TaxID=490629 RepID=UPI001FE408A7|nr:hypothetical protein [Amycolatopsis marina]
MQRTLVEVALANPEADLELRRLATHLLHNGERSERLIDGLLTLARSDRGLSRRIPVRLDELVGRLLAGVGELARDRGVTVDEALRPCTVSGDPVLLERLVDWCATASTTTCGAGRSPSRSASIARWWSPTPDRRCPRRR